MGDREEEREMKKKMKEIQQGWRTEGQDKDEEKEKEEYYLGWTIREGGGGGQRRK